LTKYLDFEPELQWAEPPDVFYVEMALEIDLFS